jgi:hypothetical protein
LGLSQVGKDGETLRDTLKVVQRVTGKIPEELIYPAELPPFLEPIWNDFLNLNSTRQNGMSVNPISYTEIAAYASLMQKRFSRFEVAVIKKLDALAIGHFNQNKSKG